MQTMFRDKAYRTGFRLNTLTFLLMLFSSICLADGALKEYPPIPFLGNKTGSAITKDGIVLYEIYQPRGNMWYVKVPRDLVNASMVSDPSYADLTLGIMFISVYMEFKFYLYTRDVNYDYYKLEKTN
jgi:hypothetical protein